MEDEQPEDDLSAYDQIDPEMVAHIGEMMGASHRAGAIVVAAQVEDALVKVIATRLIKLTSTENDRLFIGTNAPFSSFYAKIHVGYSMGVYAAPARDDLIAIKDIRNLFAHRLEVRQFSHPEVAKLCARLNFPHSVIGVPDGLLGPIDMNNPPRRF